MAKPLSQKIKDAMLRVFFGAGSKVSCATEDRAKRRLDELAETGEYCSLQQIAALCNASRGNPAEYYYSCAALGLCTTSLLLGWDEAAVVRGDRIPVEFDADEGVLRLQEVTVPITETGLLLGQLLWYPDDAALFVPHNVPTPLVAGSDIHLVGEIGVHLDH